MNTHFETNFTVLPMHTNYHPPMIFGGAFFAEIDLCAAACVNRFLHDSTCESAVTHLVENLKFLAPCYVGDIIYIEADVVGTGKKSIVVNVVARRERRDSPKLDLVAEAKFVFVSIEHTNDVINKPQKLPYKEHGLTLPELS